MVAEKVFVNFYNLIFLGQNVHQSMLKSTGTKVKKIIFKVSLTTNRSRCRNLDLRLPRDVAERNIFGYTTLVPVFINVGDTGMSFYVLC